jgi:arabinan endo-1,5-alpha-L-arabinosidase
VLEHGACKPPELYLCFGSFWDNIFSLRMTSPITIDPGTFSHLELNMSTYDPAEFHTGRNPSEGASQFAWPLDEEGSVTADTKYYLFWSSGNCCSTTELVPIGNEYKIMVCRSHSPTGPLIDRDGDSSVSENGRTIFLATQDNVYAPGGQGVMFDQGLERAIIYYYYRKSCAYVTLLTC